MWVALIVMVSAAFMIGLQHGYTRRSRQRPRPTSIWVELHRWLTRIVLLLVYRLRVEGHENLPRKGPALLIANHVSFLDSVVILASTRRHVRFVIDHRWAKNWFVRYFCELDDAIEIAPRDEAESTLEDAYLQIDEALAAGELVCIFPEGSLTPDGKIAEFRRGMEKILRRRPVPVVPMGLIGFWESVFSRNRTRNIRAEFNRRLVLKIGRAVRGHGLSARRARVLVGALLSG